jgi:hypothetical protein
MAVAAAVLLAAATAVRAASLLVVGETRTVVRELPPGAPQAPPSIVHVPYLPAVIPLAAAALLLAGLLSRTLWLAWVGLAVLCVFGVLFVFSHGLLLLPVAGLLLLLLPLIHFLQREAGGSRRG